MCVCVYDKTEESNHIPKINGFFRLQIKRFARIPDNHPKSDLFTWWTKKPLHFQHTPLDCYGNSCCAGASFTHIRAKSAARPLSLHFSFLDFAFFAFYSFRTKFVVDARARACPLSSGKTRKRPVSPIQWHRLRALCTDYVIGESIRHDSDFPLVYYVAVRLDVCRSSAIGNLTLDTRTVLRD